jgi:hypothetical protein
MIETGRFGTWNERENYMACWPAELRERFQRDHHNPFALTVFLWKFFLDNIWYEKTSRYLQVSYEDFIASPTDLANRILRFMEVPESPRIAWLLSRRPPEDNRFKWKASLKKEQLDEFFEIVVEERFLGLLRDH